MTKHALGMIEVRGLLGSIIAADVALKTANVHLVNNYTIKGGLTSVELFGDVGAITESVRAASESVMDRECYISSNVIANLDPQVEQMIIKAIENKQEKEESSFDSDGKVKEDNYQKLFIEFLRDNDRENISSLEELKVTELRSLAYLLEISSLSKKEIKFANKKTLIDTLLKEGVGNFAR